MELPGTNLVDLSCEVRLGAQAIRELGRRRWDVLTRN